MDGPVDSLVIYYGRVMLEPAAADVNVACADHLERSLLDYGLQSLDAIDRYLLVDHGAQEGIPTIAYANTIIGTAIYIGEVIRRNSPTTEFRWGRFQEIEDKSASQSFEFSDLSDLVLRSSTTGVAISPTDPILRRIRYGVLAPTIRELALAAIRRAWLGSPETG